MRWHVSLVPGILLVAGCMSLPAQLKPYPGIEQKILDYYNGQMINEGPDCLQTEMQGISALHVLRDTPHHVSVSVRYFYQSMDYDEHRGVGCAGSDDRVFTFDKTGGGLTITKMSPPLSTPYGNEL